MLKNGKKVILLVSLSLIVILFCYNYIFNIYETTIITEPQNLYANSHSVVKILINPVNALGFKVPFRKISSSFEITEGKDLVDIVKQDNKSGYLVLRARNKTGKVVIYIKSGYSFLPSLVEINIYPNSA